MKKALYVIAAGLLVGCSSMSPAQKAAMEMNKYAHPKVIKVGGEELVSIVDWRTQGNNFHVVHSMYRLKDGKLQFIPVIGTTAAKSQKVGTVKGIGKNDKEAWQDASEKMQLGGYKDCRLVRGGRESNSGGVTEIEFDIYTN